MLFCFNDDNSYYKTKKLVKASWCALCILWGSFRTRNTYLRTVTLCTEGNQLCIMNMAVCTGRELLHWKHAYLFWARTSLLEAWLSVLGGFCALLQSQCSPVAATLAPCYGRDRTPVAATLGLCCGHAGR